MLKKLRAGGSASADKTQTAPAKAGAQGAARPSGVGAAAAAVVTKPAVTEQLPSFKDTPAGERQALFKKKLSLCSQMHDFNATDNNREKEVKRLNLLEIMDYINTTKGVFNEGTFEEITHMISANLFRGLAPNNTPSQYDPDEDEPVLEVAWPHLQYVYEFLLRFVVSNETDPKVVKKHITQDFLVRLLDLFDSEDPRERDYLKTILHRIYGKFMPYRAFIRKAINSIFFRFIYETQRHNGIAELLEILGSIINGFALPLKEEHKTFLTKFLLPLHKVHHVSMYHQQLSYCVTQFVEKDPKLAEGVLLHILEVWPLTHSAKEVLFLNEVEEILEMVPAESDGTIALICKPLFTRIALCVGSPHFQVAERALFLWNNEYIVSLIATSRNQVLPLVFEALYKNSRSHWNSTVHGLTCNVVKLFMEMDSALFDECSATHNERMEQIPKVEKKKQQDWEEIEEEAKKHKLYNSVKLETASQSAQRLCYVMEAQYKKGDDQANIDVKFDAVDAVSVDFSKVSLNPTSDALKRKSMLVTSKK